MTSRSIELREIAQRISDALPQDVEEVVLTGSVSRGVADDNSDIEMLVVTPGEPELGRCFEAAAAAGLTELGTWGPQGTPAKKVSGYREGVPIELIWWSRASADAAVDSLLAGELTGTGDALANGIAVRTSGHLARWQERLADFPDELVRTLVDNAALTWGGFAAAGLLTIARPADRLARIERITDDASRVVRIVYAINRVWPPTNKRLAERAAALPVKPDRLVERIGEALTEPDPRRALLAMARLQADTVALAPETPNVVRARTWLAQGIELLES